MGSGGPEVGSGGSRDGVLLFHVKKSQISVCFFVFIMLLIVDQVFIDIMFKILKTRSIIRLLAVYSIGLYSALNFQMTGVCSDVYGTVHCAI